MNTEELVETYIKIRNAIEATEDEHKAKVRKLRADMDIVSTKLLDLCNEHELDSIKTSAGTVTRKVSSRYWPSDWEEMYKFIDENDAMYLFEKRLNQGNMKEFLEENPNLVPPGLQIDRKYKISVRKPTSR